jgi:hypothetical protein
MLTEAAPVFAGFEGRGFLRRELWLVELWIAFAEWAMIESGSAYCDVKSSKKIIRFQRPESPPSENRGERGSLGCGGIHKYRRRLRRPANPTRAMNRSISLNVPAEQLRTD